MGRPLRGPPTGSRILHPNATSRCRLEYWRATARGRANLLRPPHAAKPARDISRARDLAWTHHDGTHASHHNGADRRAKKCDAPQYWKAVTSGLEPARRED